MYFCNKIFENPRDKKIMAQSSIITGQYVELTQTPSSVGDRILAAIIDYVVLVIYSIALSIVDFQIIDGLNYANDVLSIAFYVILVFPIIFYFPMCEIFAKGQSLGKMLMKIRVVTTEGNSPSVSSCLLRWILYPIDTFLTGFLGVVFVVFGKHRQRLGDLAAGTMVIKMTSAQYDFYTLSDYSYVQQGYEPSFPEAAYLSTKQVDVITRALYNSAPKRREELIYKLAIQVQQFLDVQVEANVYADEFLRTVLNDFYYYSSTIEV